MADIDAFEFITDDHFTEVEQASVEAMLHRGFDIQAGAGAAVYTGDDGEPLNLHVAVAQIDGPQWIVHLLRREEAEDGAVTWDSVWATVEVYHEHDFVTGGEELDCAECGGSLATHRDVNA